MKNIKWLLKKGHFNKKSFRIVKSKIEMIDVDFIKVDKTD
tara:strand:- start:425 stop:544 length:120 start_codon:yes stop_codon:yes gene_type:complete